MRTGNTMTWFILTTTFLLQWYLHNYKIIKQASAGETEEKLSITFKSGTQILELQYFLISI